MGRYFLNELFVMIIRVVYDKKLDRRDEITRKFVTVGRSYLPYTRLSDVRRAASVTQKHTRTSVCGSKKRVVLGIEFVGDSRNIANHRRGFEGRISRDARIFETFVRQRCPGTTERGGPDTGTWSIRFEATSSIDVMIFRLA